MNMFAVGDTVVHEETGGEYEIMATPTNAITRFTNDQWRPAYIYYSKQENKYFVRNEFDMCSGKFKKKEPS